MLNFDADVNKTTARHQCENCFKRKYETTQNVLALCLSFANIFAMMRIVADESSRPKLGIEFYAWKKLRVHFLQVPDSFLR